MHYLYTDAEAKGIDDHAVNVLGFPSLVLMEKAAMTVAAVIMKREPKDARVLAVCGVGNNGGDGIAAARILHQQGYQAAVTIVGDTGKMTEETKRQMTMAVSVHVPVLPLSSIKEGQFDILLDGVFGIGLSRPPEGAFCRVLEEMNASGLKIYALDVPSGVQAGTGAVYNAAVRADCTITFGVNKLGLVLYPGCEYAGEVLVGDIGFPAESVERQRPSSYIYGPEDLSRLPERPARSHKGTFGKVLVIAGCETMSGACYLAAKAAYTAGAGLVQVISTENNRDILLTALPEILFSSREGILSREDIAGFLDSADAVVIGPGLGQSREAEELVRYVIEEASVPTVIDGDGIRLCRKLVKSLPENFILTPHVKEMSCLTGWSVPQLQGDILGSTRAAAREWCCVMVQKDARTLVSAGDENYVNVSGNSGMAAGGAGDVLAGLIAGLCAQGMAPFEAAKLGVYLHGLGGDAMREERSSYSLMASDIIEGISRVLSEKEAVDERI